jgi:arylsulfatase A-like enzyme
MIVPFMIAFALFELSISVVAVIAEHPAIFGMELMAGLAAGVGLAAFAGLVAGFFLRAVVSSWLRLIARKRQGRATSTWWSLLWRDPGDAHLGRIAHILSLLLVAAGFAVGSFESTRYTLTAVARPKNIAGVVLGTHVLLLMAASALYPLILQLLRRALALAARVPGVRWPLRLTGRAVVGLLAVGIGIGAFVGYQSRTMLGYLPWSRCIWIALALVCAALASFAWRRVSRRLAAQRRVLRWVLAGALLVFGLRAATLPGHAALARDAMSAGLLSGAVARAIEVALDFDGDGEIAGFGGGDCAPWDSQRHAGASDLPDNGVDENCDGADLRGRALTELRGRWNYDVPEHWPRRPSILLLTVDAFATRVLEEESGRKYIPNLHALSKSGVSFTSAFSQGPSTRLSFPSMFTSRYDTMIGQKISGRWPFEMTSENLTLAEVLRDSGYKTIAVVPDAYFAPTNWRGLTQGFETVETRAIVGGHAAHTASGVTDAAIQQLRHKDARPLFLWAHYYDPHTPHEQPEDVPRLGPSTREVYLAELMHVDRHLGRLLLHAREVLPEALIVLTADHGISFTGRRGGSGYGHDLSTDVLHVPLIFSAPFLRPARPRSLASTLDIMPTVVNLLELKKPFAFSGYSLLPELSGRAFSRPQVLFGQYFLGERKFVQADPLRMVAVRTPEYNLVYQRFDGQLRLWRWRDDYEEELDLASMPEHREQFNALKRTAELFVHATYGNPDAQVTRQNPER